MAAGAPLAGARRVVSFSHEFLVDLFRKRGDLAPALLEACAQIAFLHQRVEERSIDLSQVASTEYRADAVVVLDDGNDKPAAAIVVEVQLRVDDDKEYAWPVYVTTLRAKLRCPVVLLVLTPDPGTARWARTPIPLGHRFFFEPVVIEFNNLPRVTDPTDAQRLPQLAVLSALAHPELEVVLAAQSAIAGLPADQVRLYWDVIVAALPSPLRKLLESHMQGYVYQSEFARKYYSQGHEKGLEEGHEKGLEEGHEKGLEEGREENRAVLQRVLRGLIKAKLPQLTADEQVAIEALRDHGALQDLIDAVLDAANTDGVRAALAAVRTRG